MLILSKSIFCTFNSFTVSMKFFTLILIPLLSALIDELAKSSVKYAVSVFAPRA